jgi:hypothetical protein
VYPPETIVMSKMAFALALWWCAAQSTQRTPAASLQLAVLAPEAPASVCRTAEPDPSYLQVLGDVLEAGEGVSLAPDCEPDAQRRPSA